MRDAECKADCYCGIHRIATSFQDGKAGIRSVCLSADHHRVASTIWLCSPNQSVHHAGKEYQTCSHTGGIVAHLGRACWPEYSTSNDRELDKIARISGASQALSRRWCEQPVSIQSPRASVFQGW